MILVLGRVPRSLVLHHIGEVGVVLLAVVVLGGVLFVCRRLTRWAHRRGQIDNRWRRSTWILAAIGLGAVLTESYGRPALLWLVVGLIAVAVLAKTSGGALGALGINQWRERWLIGFGMVALGEIALVIATLGFEQGHLSHPVFVSIVLVAIVLAVLGPLLMTPLAIRVGSERSAGENR